MLRIEDDPIVERIAIRLSNDIRVASFLGKHAKHERGRRRAYQVKHLKISTALLRFSKFFRIVEAARDPRWGVLVLVRLPDGSGAHAPFSYLTTEAQLLFHPVVASFIEGKRSHEGVRAGRDDFGLAA